MSGSYPGVVSGGGSGGIALTDLDATTPLLYDEGTGTFSLPAATTSDPGYLAAADKTKIDALGSAAYVATSTFATAAQGATADTALQPEDIGSTVQAFDSDLASIAGLSTATFGRSLLTQADDAAARSTLVLTRAGEIDSGFAAATAFSVPRKNAAGTAIEYARPSFERLSPVFGTFTLTGTTSETNLTSITIPASTLVAGNQLVIESVWEVTNNANGKVGWVRINGASPTSGSVIIANTFTTIATAWGVKSIYCGTSSLFFQTFIVTNSPGTANTFTTVSVDYAQPLVLYFNASLNNSADTISLRYASVVIYR